MERITYQIDGHVAVIGLARADKRNAFDTTMLAELAQAYTDFEENPDARCALVHADGDHFTGGLDLAEVGPALAGGNDLFDDTLVDPLGLRQRRRTKPVVIAVQGFCLTIGVELALASDVVIAATGTKFSQIEVARGIYPFGGATLRFPAVAGWGNAMRWLLTGDFFGVDEAMRMGIVQEVVEPEALFAHAKTIALRIAAQAPLAVATTIESARAGIADGFDVEAARLLDRGRALMNTEDAAEGMKSFVERRPGKYSGR